jgi:hypothetical protein
MFSSFRPQLRSIMGALAVSTGAFALVGALPASAGDLGPFGCTNRSGGAASHAATVYNVRVAHHDGYDRLVIGFPTTNGMPEYHLTRQATSTFLRDASGQPVTLGGSAGIRVVLRNADVTQGAPTDVKAELPAIREVAQIGNFERVVSYGVGLASPACFRVLELSGPTRLVIDVQTAADAPAATSVASAPSAAAAPSAAPSQSMAPSNLAATGNPSHSAPQATFPLAALILGLLVLTAGLAATGLRRFAKK